MSRSVYTTSRPAVRAGGRETYYGRETQSRWSKSDCPEFTKRPRVARAIIECRSPIVFDPDPPPVLAVKRALRAAHVTADAVYTYA